MQQVPADLVIDKLVSEIAQLHRELAIVRVQLELSNQPLPSPIVVQSTDSPVVSAIAPVPPSGEPAPAA